MIKVYGYDYSGNRTSVSVDTAIFGYLACQMGDHEKARDFIKGVMSDTRLREGGPGLSRVVAWACLGVIVKPSLKRRSEEIQTDIEDLC